MENIDPKTSEEKITEIVREELEKIDTEDFAYSFLRVKIESIVKNQINDFGYKLRNITNDNKSYLSSYTADLISREIAKFINEDQIKTIIAEVVIEEISKMPTYILRAITDILRESMTGISNQKYTNMRRIEDLKKIVSEKFNVYIP